MTERGVKGREPAAETSHTIITGSRLEELVSRAKRCEVEAFQELYGVYANKILNYAYRMTGSRQEAEDLTHDTFILAYEHISSLKDNGKFQSWLFRIAQNNIYQRYRTQKPEIELNVKRDESGRPGAQRQAISSRNPEQQLLSKELEDIIQKSVHALPERQRQVFVLSAIHKLSYQEIAEIADRSLAAVKSDIHRARVAVRDKIKSYLGDKYGMSNLY